MKFSNFKFIGAARDGGAFAAKLASVDVTTGFWIWRKTETRQLFIAEFGICWRWADSGELAGLEIQDLADAHFAIQKLKKDGVLIDGAAA